MIEEFPWIAPALSWIIVLVLLSLVVVASVTTRRATHNDYIVTLLGALMLAIVGTITSMLTLFPRGTFDLYAVGLVLAILRGIASVLYLGVLLHMMAVAPRIVRKVDDTFDKMMPLSNSRRR